MDSINISLGFAFLAGLASFLSPCVFSLVPAYISYLSGRSVASISGGDTSRITTLLHGLAFVLGFSTVFISLGIGASAIGSLLYDLSPILAKIGGVVVILLGLHMTGLIRIPFLQYDLRRQVPPDKKWGYLSSALMGIFFSAGWSPCVGPVLGAILTLAASRGSVSQGVSLLTAYSIGLAIPFLVAATQVSLVTLILRRYGKIMHYVEVGMGMLLIGVGILLFFGEFQRMASLGSFFTSFDEILVGGYILIGLVALSLLGLIPAAIAYKKGRAFLDWWFFGAALFPVALPLVITLKPIEKKASNVQSDA